MTDRRATTALLLAAALAAAGCSAPPNRRAVRAYYDYDFTGARAALRDDARINDEQVLLNLTRLGAAALDDGDLAEAERALGGAFELLSTAGLNEDRTVGAVLVHEGVRVWKGEPFEQALAYHLVSTLYAVRGEWDNARAAAANALFRLVDFERDQRRDAEPRAVDTSFALGFLMQAIGSDLSGASGAGGQLDAAVSIDPALAPLAERLRARDYDTLLLVAYGKGPTKIAVGPDRAIVRFERQERVVGPLVARAGDEVLAELPPACDVNAMAVDHRWNHLESVRRTKCAIGTGLLLGGNIVAAHGAYEDSGETFLAGLGLIAAGLLAKAGAEGDVRYLELAPASLYVVPLRLAGRPQPITIEVGTGPPFAMPPIAPGAPGAPRAVALRLHGPDSPAPPWLGATAPRYGHDHAGVRPGDYPWILGGRDVCTPTRETLEAYHAGGHLRDLALADLRALYAAEGIAIGAGRVPPGGDGAPAYRHVLEGGRALFTPAAGSVGLKRLMYQEHPPYAPRSALVRNLARTIRVQPRAAGPAAASPGERP